MAVPTYHGTGPHSTQAYSAASSTQQTSSNQSSHNASLNGASGTNGAVEESVGDTKPPCNDWIRRMLFPRESDGQVQTELRKLPFQGMFDRLINYEQLQSVNSVSKQNYGVMPFIISGPPGTGKTKTIVETTMQLVHTTDIAHVLVVAPSEPAADTLALRLKKYLTPQQLLRLNGPWRADNEVPAEILSHCHMERGMFYIPPFAQLMKYNVVVTSTRDASILADARVTNNDLYHIETNMHSAFHSEGHHRPETLHWGALLMDEAAQATELDTLAALSIVCPPSAWPMGDNVAQPCFIMAGDQHQLGPRTASLHPEYSRSLFARLAERTAYSDHPLSRSRARPTNRPLVMTARMLPMLYPPFANLTRNYRSHPAILTFPSCEFYNDTLIPEAPVPTTPLQHSPLWKGRGWPVLFVPNSGPDDIERDGGGWYNMSEAKVARDVALHLVMNSGVAERDIVIMSPFAAQVKRLRAVVRTTRYWNRSGMWDVNIGPLEAFQGLESRVVILCVTRTKEKFVDLDVQRGLGVVGQRRQMNVALTRAKEGLIVIGDPKVMKMDPHWRRWLAFCQRNGLVQESLWSLGLQREYQDVGVLERALLAKDELRNNHSGRVLGAAAMLEDEMWTAGLEAALDEYDDGYHEEAESDGDDEATLV
ncbi:P-loop containing nucleoside triphosphate hydrolase protein [Aaosphaeria arxii CBS 175.79]|uniref:P-loop containing nucleoside triphosphate hydrolase protein n=1 Tax=Aaosphaeria arxii CBS 175.79 TaxID=1450172 RepID=A0A6A5Y840_9PLEO|nr:P-loop containing nucleoside triphosphate hydrolase protein [Aaosphaeria arxii CBS 175.79]KAF2020911.1 P-loop containing nucleoside triphosphate hydrolase protein [Aaosphaeria arxii CBS 175.79]